MLSVFVNKILPRPVMLSNKSRKVHGKQCRAAVGVARNVMSGTWLYDAKYILVARFQASCLYFALKNYGK